MLFVKSHAIGVVVNIRRSFALTCSFLEAFIKNIPTLNGNFCIELFIKCDFICNIVYSKFSLIDRLVAQ